MYLNSKISKASSQVNLVPNYSFEQNSGCPDNNFGILNANNWYSPTLGSPDYFHSCSVSNTWDVPSNIVGFQNPLLGNAYVGISAYYTPTPNGREYMSVKLTNTLLSGKIYCLDFYISLADSSNYGISGIGFFLSKDSLSVNTNFQIDSIPQIIFNTFLIDKTNWIQLTAIFNANGGEEYLTIGNFATDLNTSDTIIGGQYPIAYYYIDNVSLTYCDEDTSSVGIIPNVFTPNGDDKNETFLIPNTGLQTIDCKIYNRWGSIVYNITAPNDFWDGHTTSGEPCSSGVYYYILTATGVDGKEYLRNGYVQLAR